MEGEKVEGGSNSMPRKVRRRSCMEKEQDWIRDGAGNGLFLLSNSNYGSDDCTKAENQGG